MGLYHIGHRPYRPHEKTILAKRNNHIGHKKMYCYLASTFISCQSETRNVVRNPVSHKRRVKERNNCRHISKRFEYIIARVIGVWATIHCPCSSPTVSLEQECELSDWPTHSTINVTSLSYLLTIVDSTAHYMWNVYKQAYMYDTHGSVTSAI